MECKQKIVSPTKTNLVKDIENFFNLNQRSITSSKNEKMIRKCQNWWWHCCENLGWMKI
jgi:hypothetical protein